MNWRRLVGRDWLCQGCWRQGSQRWLEQHPCPERDAFEEAAREQFKKHPGSWLLATTQEGQHR